MKPNCFKCESEGRERKASLIVIFMGVETPICKRCYKQVLKEQEGEFICITRNKEEVSTKVQYSTV